MYTNTNSFNEFLGGGMCGISIDSTEDSWQPSDPGPLLFVPVISHTNIADSALCLLPDSSNVLD